jgi:hypothetical protein
LLSSTSLITIPSIDTITFGMHCSYFCSCCFLLTASYFANQRAINPGF